LLGSATALGNIRRQLLGQSGPVRTLTCGRLNVVRDYVPLEVVGRTFATLAAATARPEVVNVCSGVGIAIGEIVDAAAEVLGVSVEVTEDPQLAALPAPDRVVGDPGDLEALLGPLPTTSAASIAELLVG
jgi:UDP-glucose 4-epimerase